MKKIILFDPACGTRNLGDYIIEDSVMKQMDFLFKDSFVVKYSTHTPMTHLYQLLHANLVLKSCKESDYKFLGGSNLLKTNLRHLSPDFNVHWSDSFYYKGAICIGCGVDNEKEKFNLYTKYLLRRILSDKYIHSVRDDKTKKMLEEMGFRAINTGCSTLWGLTKEFCRQIPKSKASQVVFTLTDYCRDELKDKEFVSILKKNYDKLYYWIQGDQDLEYLSKITNLEDIHLISPSLESYKSFLDENDVDYIGTRLHAGIFAMQRKKRAIIIIVDNRARDMKKTYQLNCIEREEIEELENLINQEIKTDVDINEAAINEWKKQFKEN